MSFGEILLLSLAVASTSVTVSKSIALEWFRDKFSKLGKWPEELIHCPYCVSHWLAGVGVLMMSDELHLWPVVVTTMAVVTLASLVSVGIVKYFLTLDELEENE